MRRRTKGTHFTLETRLFIEDSLNSGKSITEISKDLYRDRGNLSREVLRHRILTIPSIFGEINNCNCCTKRNNCHQANHTKHTNCREFTLELCDKLKSSPHVCNGCTTKSGCRKAKYNYKATEANTQYQNSLRNTRLGMHYSEIELNILNTDFYCLVKQSCSIYHSLLVLNNNGWNFKKSTVYKQIKDGLLRLKPSDLPRISNRKKPNHSIDKTYKRDIENHTFEDYEEYKKSNPIAIEWQMDCVQGITGKDQQVFLTLQIVKIKFLFIFIMNNQTAEKVKKTLQQFKKTITPEVFDKIIDIILTDNGHEFIRIEDLTSVCMNVHIFYCHPYSSYEKGSIENNHELIRRCIPQGVSLNVYTQDDINLLTSNINSLYREELEGNCPFDLVDKYISIDTLNKLGLQKIEDKNVNLSPNLLGDKNIKNIKKWLSEDDIKKANISFD